LVNVPVTAGADWRTKAESDHESTAFPAISRILNGMGVGARLVLVTAAKEVPTFKSSIKMVAPMPEPWRKLKAEIEKFKQRFQKSTDEAA